MKRNIINIIIKYAFFVAFIIWILIHLYRDMTTISDDMERSLQVWTRILQIITMTGIVLTLLVTDCFSIMLEGKTTNVLVDYLENDSKDKEGSINALIAGITLSTVFMGLILLYVITGKEIFLTINSICIIVCILGFVINLLSQIIQAKEKNRNPETLGLLEAVLIPVVIYIIQLVITTRTTVGIVFQNIKDTQNTVSLILTLIGLLCYILTMGFCYFSNLYCILGYIVTKLDPLKYK